MELHIHSPLLLVLSTIRCHRVTHSLSLSRSSIKRRSPFRSASAAAANANSVHRRSPHVNTGRSMPFHTDRSRPTRVIGANAHTHIFPYVRSTRERRRRLATPSSRNSHARFLRRHIYTYVHHHRTCHSIIITDARTTASQPRPRRDATADERDG
jgi:hypothetical protein